MPTEQPERGDAPLISPEDLIRRTALIDSARAERRALSVCTLLAVGTIFYITRPVGVGILLGALLAFSTQDLYERISTRTGRPRATAAAFVAVSTTGLLVVLGGLSSLFIARGIVLAQALIASLAPGAPLRDFAERTSLRMGRFQFRSDDVVARIQDAAADVATSAAAIATGLASVTFNLLMTLFFAMMTLAVVLVRWKALLVSAEDLLPLRPRYTRALLTELHRTGRSTLLGTVITGLAQGVFAALGYWVAGVPEPAFFGAATAVASLVPVVGTVLVWVPAGVFLIARGHVVAGVLELCWGALVVVGVSDYLLRPRLVGGHGTMPPLATFAALIGGVEVFGLAGLLVGPLLMSISLAILRIFAADSEERRARGERHT